jgi:hypothetical protein
MRWIPNRASRMQADNSIVVPVHVFQGVNQYGARGRIVLCKLVRPAYDVGSQVCGYPANLMVLGANYELNARSLSRFNRPLNKGLAE